MGLNRQTLGPDKFIKGLDQFALGQDCFTLGLDRFTLGLDWSVFGLDLFPVGLNRQTVRQLDSETVRQDNPNQKQIDNQW